MKQMAQRIPQEAVANTKLCIDKFIQGTIGTEGKWMKNAKESVRCFAGLLCNSEAFLKNVQDVLKTCILKVVLKCSEEVWAKMWKPHE